MKIKTIGKQDGEATIGCEHEYLLFRNTLRKLGVWEEFLTEKKQYMASRKTSTAKHVDEEYVKLSLMEASLYHDMGFLLEGFSYIFISFPWDAASTKVKWSTIYEKIRKNPILRHFGRNRQS